MRATSLFCWGISLIRAMRCWAWEDRLGCNACTASKPASRRAAIWKKERNCIMPCADSSRVGWSRARTIAAKRGPAVALAESCISHQIARETPSLIGAQIDLSAEATAAIRLDALLFGETQGRIIISVAPMDAVKVVERAKILGVSAIKLGTTGGSDLVIKRGDVECKWAAAESAWIAGGTLSPAPCNKLPRNAWRQIRVNEWTNKFFSCAGLQNAAPALTVAWRQGNHRRSAG